MESEAELLRGQVGRLERQLAAEKNARVELLRRQIGRRMMNARARDQPSCIRTKPIFFSATP